VKRGAAREVRGFGTRRRRVIVNGRMAESKLRSISDIVHGFIELPQVISLIVGEWMF
jgi:hypothetical protein